MYQIREFLPTIMGKNFYLFIYLFSKETALKYSGELVKFIKNRLKDKFMVL